MTTTLKEEIARAEKLFGKGTIFKLGDASLANVGSVSTGVPSLDAAIGIGGVPRGRITEMFGPPGGGKSTIAQQIIAQAQNAGGTAVYIDSEHSLDPTYARALGVNTDNLYVCQPSNGEEALDLCQGVVRSKEVDVVVVDSVATLVPKSEVEGSVGDSYMGLHARLMSQGLRMLLPDVGDSKTAVVFINQTRMKIGVVYGNPETTTGGMALPFYASVRISIRPGTAIKDGDTVVGNRTKAKIVKNKVAPPFRETEFDIIYGQGAPYLNSLVDVCTEQEIIDKSGAWFTFPTGRRCQGRDAVISALRDDTEAVRSLREKLQEKLAQ